MTKAGDLASAIGKGLVAGAAGTVAITASQLLAQRVLGQEESSAPADAVEKLIGVEPKDEGAKRRLGMLTHFVYGAGWGIPRALMELFGLRGWSATGVHFGMVQGSGTMLPALDIGPAPTEIPPKELGIEAVHHAVYAVTTGLVLEAIDRRSERLRLAA